jgi:hypothetical protein
MESEAIAIASAGDGLPADQLILTANGITALGKLGAGSSADVLSYDLPRRRFLRLNARLVAAGPKTIVKVQTDKGPFTAAAGQQVMLEDGSWVAAGELEPGMRLRAFTSQPTRRDLVEGQGDCFRSADAAQHELIGAECAVANWYPVPAVTTQGQDEACTATLDAAIAFPPNLLLWIAGPAGGVGIVVAAQRAS